MARPRRLVVPGGLYHVVARGNGRKPIFRDESDRRFYLSRVAHYRERDGFRLIGWCLMENILHLAIETGDVPLSKTMAGLQTSYTQAFNRKYRRTGPLFRGRYKATLVDRESYGRALVRYIHRNPVAAGLAPRGVDDEWSSARAWSRGAGPEWLDLDAGLRLFGPTAKRALAVYRSHRHDADDGGYGDLPAFDQQVKGSEGFVEELRRRAESAPPKRKRPSLEAVAREVAQEEGISLASLRAPGRSRREAWVRALVAARALEEGGISLAKSARFFGRDGSTMVRAVARLRDGRRGIERKSKR